MPSAEANKAIQKECTKEVRKPGRGELVVFLLAYVLLQSDPAPTLASLCFVCLSLL